VDTVGKALILVLTGIILLRIAGRKSISQMTLAQTVVMVSIGSIIIQPIIEKSMWRTITAAAIFVVVLILLEYLQVRMNKVEKFITGKSIIVVQNGQLQEKNMKKLRFTVDQLEMRLRQQGVSKISDVKYATLEPNGQLGYELKEDARPLTVGEFKKMMSSYYLTLQQNQNPNDQELDLFQEIESNKQDKHNPEHLQ
jgi:uncharacterized membrane protein YcaP (DUF421 family)